ncbi:MAG: Hsp70 family protein [Pseudanabaenaceae cyanobacterium]
MGAIAIDFGSSNTVVAQWQTARNTPETLYLPGLGRPHPQEMLIPSLLYVQNAATGRVLVGQEVRERGYDFEHPRYFGQIKRRLVTGKGFLPELDGVKLSAQWLGTAFLQRVMAQVQALQWQPTELILTVPVQSCEAYLRWLEKALQPLTPESLKESQKEFEKDSKKEFQKESPTNSPSLLPSMAIAPRVRLLDEPTAAALGYAVTTPNSFVLCIDFGGGTLDVALVRLPACDDIQQWGSYVKPLTNDSADHHQDLPSHLYHDYQAEVIAKSGQSIGGDDVDWWLVEHFAQTLNHPLRPGDRHFLKQIMERVKMQLSEATSVTEVWFNPVTQGAVNITYNRQELEEILQDHGFFQVLQHTIEEVISLAFQKGILKGEIRHILLVGGATLIPSVQERIMAMLPNATVHKDKPFEAVAHGALMIHQGLGLQDRLFHSYAMRYWDSYQQQWQYQPLFRAGQNYPTKRHVSLTLRASKMEQVYVDLILGELEKHQRGNVEIIFDGEKLLTQVQAQPQEVFIPLKQDSSGAPAPQIVAELVPRGIVGQDRLQLSFTISERRELLVTVDDLVAECRILSEYPAAQLH